jgi:hypothetical protein
VVIARALQKYASTLPPTENSQTRP